MFSAVTPFCFIALVQDMDVHVYCLFRTRLNSDF